MVQAGEAEAGTWVEAGWQEAVGRAEVQEEVGQMEVVVGAEAMAAAKDRPGRSSEDSCAGCPPSQQKCSKTKKYKM